jgi:hypothetical protein
MHLTADPLAPTAATAPLTDHEHHARVHKRPLSSVGGQAICPLAATGGAQ